MLKVCLVLGALSLCASVAAAPYMRPWTTPTMKGKSISCWGREYRFDRSLMPAGMVSQGRDILARPIEIVAVVGGKKLAWGEVELMRTTADGEAAGYVTEAKRGHVAVTCRFSTEFDGVTRVDLAVIPSQAVKLDSLDLVFPIKSEYAKLFHHSSVYPVFVWDWPKKRMNSGAVPADGMRLPFVFHLWLGSDERGLQVFSESDQGWAPADPEGAITVTPKGGVTTLKMNLLHDTTLSAEWKWSFGFVATPVKPFAPDYHKMHYCQMGAYGEEKNQYSGEPADAEHPAYLDVMAKMGVKYLGFHENWSDEQSLPRPAKREAELRSLIAACRERGMRLVPYTGCYMSTRSPEYNKDWDVLPIGDHYQYERPDNKDICRIVCNNSGYPEVLLSSYAAAFKQYGLGGIYMDGLTCPLPCTNTKHGCGYVGKDGEVHPTMPIWRTRALLKSFYRLVKAQDEKGIIFAHTSSSILLPALSFADFYLDGEHLTSFLKMGTPDYPEAILRAEMSGHNFGIPATHLPQGAEGFGRERARTLCLLYDSLWMWHPDHQIEAWKAFDSFDVTGAEWFGPWESASVVSIGDCQTLRASAYVQKGRGALVVIGNLSEKEASVALSVNRGALGLGAGEELRARDEVAGSDLQYGTDGVDVVIGPGRFRIVSVQWADVGLRAP